GGGGKRHRAQVLGRQRAPGVEEVDEAHHHRVDRAAFIPFAAPGGAEAEAVGGGEAGVEHGGPARDLFHPLLLPVLFDERYPFPGGEGGLHAVEGIVDGVGIVAAPHEIERGGADLRGGHLPAILVILPSVVAEVLHLVHVVAGVGNLHSGEHLRHYRSYAPVVSAAS